jgi:hypothetical protein
MNKAVDDLIYRSGLIADGCWDELGTYEQEAIERLVELTVVEFTGILEREIALLEKYKTTSCNDFDRRWHEGKIVHFHKLIDKTKDHFGVDNVGT